MRLQTEGTVQALGEESSSAGPTWPMGWGCPGCTLRNPEEHSVLVHLGGISPKMRLPYLGLAAPKSSYIPSTLTLWAASGGRMAEVASLAKNADRLRYDAWELGPSALALL